MTTIQRPCPICGKVVFAQRNQVATGRGIYCSWDCSVVGRARPRQGTWVERTCEQCAASFQARAFLVGRGGGRFCSRACANSRVDPRPIARFMEHVIIQPGPDGCWIWQGPFLRHVNYGTFSYDRGNRLAHRASYEFHTGVRPPKGLLVCHRCDTPPCVNPAHLFLGTYADNAQDMLAKGRGNPSRGECHMSAKLTDEQVTTIKERLAAGEIRAALAREYGVNYTTIHAIYVGEHWKHLS